MPKVEYVTVANHAEVINNMLYLQGAGWQTLNHPMQPNGQAANFAFGIAVSVLVGWNETNRKHPLAIAIRHEDGAELVRMDGVVEAGRPPGSIPGSDSRSCLAMTANIQFPRSGGYRLSAKIEGEEGDESSVAFRVVFPTPMGPASIPFPPIS